MINSSFTSLAVSYTEDYWMETLYLQDIFLNKIFPIEEKTWKYIAFFVKTYVKHS